MSTSKRLPEHPQVPYTKPTAQNTNGGKTYQPTHPDLFRVEFTSNIEAKRSDGLSSRDEAGEPSTDGEETFSSRLIAVKVSGAAGVFCCMADDVQDFPPHTTITHLSNLSQASAKAYSSVQFGPDQHDHFELNSDLLFSESRPSPLSSG